MTIITDIDKIVKRIQTHCPTISERVLESASLADAMNSNIARPCAHVIFNSIIPTSADVREAAAGEYEQPIMEIWEILILSSDKESGMRGKQAQRELIGMIEEVVRAITNWTPDDDEPREECPRRNCAQIEAGELTNPYDGEKYGARVTMRIPGSITAIDGVQPDTDDLHQVSMTTDDPPGGVIADTTGGE